MLWSSWATYCMASSLFRNAIIMQQRTALWITGAFQISPSEGIGGIAGLISIAFYLQKLNGHHHLCYVSIPLFHAIYSLLGSQHAKGHSPHWFITSKLTPKQQIQLRSSIKDVNKCLLEITMCFNSIHPLFSPGSRVVNHFSSRITFYSSLFSSDEDLHKHIQNLNYVFHQSQNLSHKAAVIAYVSKDNSITG